MKYKARQREPVSRSFTRRHGLDFDSEDILACDQTDITVTLRKPQASGSIEPAVADHNGRLVKLTGDGVLVEFTSAVDAVRSAVTTQKAVEAHERSEPADRRIALRIGINLGDIIVDEDDVYGDGVNLAARLEGLAEPGGIVISSAVHEQEYFADGMVEDIISGLSRIRWLTVIALQLLGQPRSVAHRSARGRSAGITRRRGRHRAVVRGANP